MRIGSFVACVLILAPWTTTARPVAPVAPLPILGAWQYQGTAPPGFTRQGTQGARITVALQGKTLHALVLTGARRYAATAQYVASRHELVISVPTVAGHVRLDAMLLTGNARMVGTWYDAHGDDGGFVLLRIPTSGRSPSR